MTVHFPGPQLLELVYTTQGLTHTMTMSVEAEADPDIGDPFGSINLVQKDTTVISATAWALLLVAELKQMFDATDTVFDAWNLYTIAPLSYDRTFINTHTPSSQPIGTAGYVASHHRIFSFATLGGNVAKLYLMETELGQNDLVGYAGMATIEKDLVDLLISDESCMLGRDGNYLAGLIRRGASQNEKIFNLRNR